MNFSKKIYTVLATGFGSGYSPFMPGTFGTFVGVVFSWHIIDYFQTNQYLFLFMCLATFFIGWFATHKIILPAQDPDPSRIVIDEIAGIMITYFICRCFEQFYILVLPFGYFYMAGFVWFRFFDILKIYPINKIEKFFYQYPFWNSFGIMIDDVMAGLMAGVCAFYSFLAILWILN